MLFLIPPLSVITNLITKSPTMWLSGTGTLDKGVIHFPGGMEWGNAKFYHATQNIMQFLTYELFISGNLYWIFLDHSWLWVTGTPESEIMDKGAYCSVFQLRKNNIPSFKNWSTINMKWTSTFLQVFI